MMLKRGLSHIEFVLSFAIFVGFLVFAFLFFNPFQSERTLKSTMDYAWIEVNQEAKGNIETYSVVIDPSSAGKDVAIKIEGISEDYNSNVEDSQGNIIPSYNDRSGTRFNVPSDGFVRIRYSDTFPRGNILTGSLLGSNEYSISSSEVDKIYFEKLFLDLNNSYYSDYEGLKEKLNLPNRVDFGFAVRFNDGNEIISLNSIPQGLEVLSRNDRIQTIRESGSLEYADLRVLVW